MDGARSGINSFVGDMGIYVGGCVCMGVGAYRFVRAMCIVMGVKRWMDGWIDEQRACVGVVRGNIYACMDIIAGGAFGAAGFGL